MRWAGLVGKGGGNSWWVGFDGAVGEGCTLVGVVGCGCVV